MDYFKQIKRKMLVGILSFLILTIFVNEIKIEFAYASTFTYQEYSMPEEITVNFNNDEDGKVYSVYELVNLYIKNSNDITLIKKEYEIYDAKNDLYKKQYDNYEKTKQKYNQLVNQNELLKSGYIKKKAEIEKMLEEYIANVNPIDDNVVDDYQNKLNDINKVIYSTEINIENYKSLFKSAVKNQADAYYNKEQFSFISKNKYILRRNDERKKINKFKTEIVNLLVYRYQLSALEKSQKYYQLVYNMNKIKYERGIILKSELDSSYLSVSKIDYDIAIINNNISNSLYKIKLDTKISLSNGISIKYNFKKINKISYEYYVKIIKNNNSNNLDEQMILNKIRAKNVYKNMLKPVYGNNSIEYRINQFEDEKLLIELNTVHEKINQNTFINKNEYIAEKINYDRSYNNVINKHRILYESRLKHDKGKLTKIQLLEKEVDYYNKKYKLISIASKFYLLLTQYE